MIFRLKRVSLPHIHVCERIYSGAYAYKRPQKLRISESGAKLVLTQPSESSFDEVKAEKLTTNILTPP